MKELERRSSPLEMQPEEFRKAGYRVVDQIADFLAELPRKPVNPAPTPEGVRELLGDEHLPQKGSGHTKLLDETAKLLFDHSLFNGHPNFWGYITSSAAPIGALGDFLASAVNPNVGSFQLAPVATEIEAQTIRWIAEMIGYPSDCGGLLVSGGNMANFGCFIAGRSAKIPWDIRKEGMSAAKNRTPRIYATTETHTWLQKAADMFGFGLEAIRWVPMDDDLKMNVRALEEQIVRDSSSGDLPLMVIGTAGSVGTGTIDPLHEIGAVCKKYNLWFHVDGAYGGFAAVLPNAPKELKALSEADSVAVDPHKWLYAPLEAGCVLVRDKNILHDAFSFHPPYYRFHDSEGEPPLNYYEYGPQNSRGFRALKVWLGLRQAGREGYERMIADDIALAKALYDCVGTTTELQAVTCGLSIATFRYVPSDLKGGNEKDEKYLNDLNTEILKRLQNGGEAYVSNAIVRGMFLLRACIVNFRTTMKEIIALPGLVVRIGKEVDGEMRKR
jgi:aromatic-L-amino-acid decarboxylase